MSIIIYRYDQPISLTTPPPPVYPLVADGHVVVFSIKTPESTLVKIQAYRQAGDDPGTMRLYRIDNQNNVQVSGQSLEWVQVPDTDTDVWVDGDLMTGHLTFRAHVEPEPPIEP